MHKSIRILRDEHRSIAAVLHGLEHLARMAQNTKTRPEFDVFRAMIYYIDAFPEREHHPKEDTYLFKRLGERVPEAAQMVADLRADHARGAQLVRELEQAVLAFEKSWPEGAGAFADAIGAYTRFHWNHMRTEEHDLLPLAERALTEEDWREIDAAFGQNADPLSGVVPNGEFARLYARIVDLAPPPIGLGGAG